MIGKITAVIGVGIISGLITPVGPGPVPNAAIGAALRNGPSAPQYETIVVDRTNKGDRLPVRQRTPDSLRGGVPATLTVPLGCDPLFSPVADPVAAHTFKRCMV